ncbi:hypothetical protein SMD44_p20016 (plasmid) [Streptomyces alboflavus]|uniref:Uncharacterized protein n=1 Tax=Streptomyces alboflavus TaxID=67267 RepID=A0A291W5F7_9ACTN|nr:hypothetical protein SMD44_p20016 [Streptomyces alboflavus]
MYRIGDIAKVLLVITEELEEVLAGYGHPARRRIGVQ